MQTNKLCPNCGKIYMPTLTRLRAGVTIQDEFPNAPAWQREQHLTGICSDQCWDEFLGPERDWNDLQGVPLEDDCND